MSPFQMLWVWLVGLFSSKQEPKAEPAYLNPTGARSVVRTASRLLRLIEAHRQATTIDREKVLRDEITVVGKRLHNLGVPRIKNVARLRALANGEKV